MEFLSWRDNWKLWASNSIIALHILHKYTVIIEKLQWSYTTFSELPIWLDGYCKNVEMRTASYQTIDCDFSRRGLLDNVYVDSKYLRCSMSKHIKCCLLNLGEGGRVIIWKWIPINNVILLAIKNLKYEPSWIRS